MSSHTLNIKEINEHRSKLQQQVSILQMQKARIPPNDYRNLMNYLQYCLTIFDNMINFKQIEENSPYNPQQIGRNGYNLARASKVIYNRDGTTKIVHPDEKNESRPEWEMQFDENIMNPPCYIQPPSNVYNIDQIKNMHKPRHL